MRSDFNFFASVRVRYSEVDQQAIVYNGNYSLYTDVAIEEFFRSKGYSYKSLADELDSEICHKKNTTEFISSAFYDDILEVGVRVVNIGIKSFTLRFEIYRKHEDNAITITENVYVGYDSINRCSRPITDLMRKLLTT